MPISFREKPLWTEVFKLAIGQALILSERCVTALDSRLDRLRNGAGYQSNRAQVSTHITKPLNFQRLARSLSVFGEANKRSNRFGRYQERSAVLHNL
jgi:hypothetical protein